MLDKCILDDLHDLKNTFVFDALFLQDRYLKLYLERTQLDVIKFYTTTLCRHSKKTLKGL